MARDDDYIVRFAGQLGRDVDHLALADRRSRAKLISRHLQTIRFQLVNHVRAELFEFSRASRSGAKLNLFADLLKGTVTIKIGSPF